MKNGHWFSLMGHTKFMAVAGIIVSVLILALMPRQGWVAGLTMCDLKLTAMTEINRILKPGGRMLLIVLTPTLSSFAILNVLSFFLATGKQWKKLFERTRFKLVTEGEINGGSYFLIEK